ncbi:subtype B tannase [Paenibacillus sp. WLX2291]|uniref:subtype B tannase n=1 Tax=Paenibacillus sp. WLX2291 TaxID=3296934 RepID=UPI003983EDDF
MNSKKWFATLVMSSMLVMPLNGITAEAASTTATGSYNLDFHTASYTEKTATLDGKTIKYRAYEKIVYVKHPVDTQYEIMNIYVPEQYYEGKSIGSYNADNAPIFFPNAIGGYMPAEPDSPGQGMGGGDNAALIALANGYVVASPGARGRTATTGKAPAAIVDLKAAVRYLRYNDSVMPGDADKIISNGTSAGGALSALLGASGNNADYEPYLTELGAADAKDDIFAVSSYTPITNLDQANDAYEWQFNGINTYSKLEISTDTDYHIQRKTVQGTLTADQIQVSNDLSAMFPAYLNSLNLKDADGNALTLNSDGTGSFRDYIQSLVIASAQKALDNGTDLSDKSWITISNGKVTDVNYDQYLAYLGRMKTPGAFDALDLSAGENQLFGTATTDTQHFTQYAQDHSTVEGSSMADAQTIKLMNPMNYISTSGTDTAPNWRIRFGTKDSDTSTAVSAMLALDLQNKGYNVDYALPWDVPHSGDYDLGELFTWMAGVAGGSTVNATVPVADQSTTTGGMNMGGGMTGEAGAPDDSGTDNTSAPSGTSTTTGSTTSPSSNTSTAPTSATTTATAGKATVKINSKTATLASYNIAGSHYVTADDLATALQATDKAFTVAADSATGSISLTSTTASSASTSNTTSSNPTRSAKASTAKASVTVDGKQVQVTAYTIQGTTYLKLRDLAQALDVNLSWQSATRQLNIDTTTSYSAEQ